MALEEYAIIGLKAILQIENCKLNVILQVVTTLLSVKNTK